MKKGIGIGVSAVGGLASAVVWAPSAQAHERSRAHGNDIAVISSDHTAVRLEDNECDGHFIRLWVEDISGRRPSYGAYGDCGDHTPWYDFDWPVVSFRLCEEDAGCTDWKAVT